MFARRRQSLRAVPVAALVLGTGLGGYTGCTGFIGDSGQGPGSSGTASGANGAQGTSGAPGAVTADASVPIQGQILPARVRLMNNAEYNNTVAALLGDTTQPANSFPPPATQLGFSNNADQVAGALLAGAFDTAGQALAATAVQAISSLLPCNPQTVGEASCAASFIGSFGARAFRRPLTSDDQSGLLGIYTTSRQNGADFPTAIQNVIYGILTSGSFLYVTELGGGGASGSVATLTPYEVASGLSYLVLASPPDATLTAAAAANALSTPGQLEAQARRLLGDPRAHAQVKRFFQEWFEIGPSTKDPTTYPDFPSVSQSFLAETPALIDDVVFNGDGTLKSLLLANYTFVDSTLASFYQIQATIPAGQLARVSLAGSNRLGILSQGSFLSVHGDEATSSPILRGVFVRRRLLCQDLPPPPPGANTTPPMPSTAKTTRQLFDAHISNPACSGCHNLIDPIGNGFENFDGEGKYRTTENGIPVDASGQVTNTQDANGNFTGVPQLAQLLAQSTEVENCYARNIFRFGSAQNGDATEQEFFNEMPAQIPSSFQDIVVGYVQTKMFGQRLNP